MPIPAPYLVGLQMYEIDDEALALRAEVWRHLGPMMDTICDRHFAKILKFTPFYEESLKKTAEEGRRLVIITPPGSFYIRSTRNLSRMHWNVSKSKSGWPPTCGRAARSPSPF